MSRSTSRGIFQSHPDWNEDEDEEERRRCARMREARAVRNCEATARLEMVSGDPVVVLGLLALCSPPPLQPAECRWCRIDYSTLNARFRGRGGGGGGGGSMDTFDILLIFFLQPTLLQ